MTVKNPSPSLYNEDLAPAEERKWGAFSIFNVWTSDVHSLWGYYLAASLFLLCGSFVNFVIATLCFLQAGSYRKELPDDLSGSRLLLPAGLDRFGLIFRHTRLRVMDGSSMP